MTVSHKFIKTLSPTAKAVQDVIFADVKPVENIERSKFETPFTSISRVLGDKFWEKTNDEVISLNIEPEGFFNPVEINYNEKALDVILGYIMRLFDDFIITNNGIRVFDEADRLKKVGTLAVISESKGIMKVPVSVSDFKEIMTFDDNNEIYGIMKTDVLQKIRDEVEKLIDASNKLRSVDPQKSIELQQKINDFNMQAIDIYKELTETFFNIVRKLTGFEDVSDIYDIQYMSTSSAKGINPETNKEEEIHETRIYDYHDSSALIIAERRKALML